MFFVLGTKSFHKIFVKYFIKTDSLIFAHFLDFFFCSIALLGGSVGIWKKIENSSVVSEQLFI